jgi:hypothetical protein
MLTIIQIVNAKGEMKGSAITGPVGKEAAELWPVSFDLTSNDFIKKILIICSTAYCFQLRCRHVKEEGIEKRNICDTS